MLLLLNEGKAMVGEGGKEGEGATLCKRVRIKSAKVFWRGQS